MALPPDEETQDRIPLVEEHARISTRSVETGRVQVHLATEEVEELVRATLKGRRATIERIPMDVEVSEPPPVRQDGDVVVVPVVEEVLVIERRLRLREEIHLRLEATEEEVEMPVRRRVQHAEVRRVPGQNPPEGDAAPQTPGRAENGKQESSE